MGSGREVRSLDSMPVMGAEVTCAISLDGSCHALLADCRTVKGEVVRAALAWSHPATSSPFGSMVLVALISFGFATQV